MAFSELEGIDERSQWIPRSHQISGYTNIYFRRYASRIRRKKRDIINDLENNLHYRSSVFLNGKNEWLSIYKPYAMQQQVDCAIEGQPMTASAVAGGFPFHFSYLEDPHGSFYGTTATAGNVIWDQFAKTKKDFLTTLALRERWDLANQLY